MTAPRRAASARRSKADKAAAAPSIDEATLAQRTSAAPAETSAPLVDPSVFDGQYRIKLESFEGPLDLLLHLIQQHELDILDIPVSFITAKYLEYLKLMQVLSIEIASEYLVMAATLVHIKSKMLLPVAPVGQDDGMPQEEEEDPRAELVRRLLEYQKYKAAAAELAERGTLGRDVFPRGVEEAAPSGPAELAKVEVFGLLEAFEKVLKRAKVKIDHEVVFDRISITDRIVELTEKLSGRRAVRFEWLFLGTSQGGRPTRFDLVITFLAMLEMCRMKLLQVYQTGPLAPIYMGLLDETAELSDEDRALADRTAEETLANVPEVAPEDAVAERGEVEAIAPGGATAPELEAGAQLAWDFAGVAVEVAPAGVEDAPSDVAPETYEVDAEVQLVWDFAEVAVEVAPAGAEDAPLDVAPGTGEGDSGAVIAEEPPASGEKPISNEDLMNKSSIGPVEITETPAVPPEVSVEDDVSERMTERDLERATLPMISVDDEDESDMDEDRPTIPGPGVAEDEPTPPADAAQVGEPDDEEPLSDEVTDGG